MSYKIQNRSPDSKRIKLIKRTDGRVQFAGNVIPTYQENTIQAGWCMAAITPLPELIDPQTTFELTAAPIGVDGRVSLYRNDTLVSSMRYNNLNSNAAKVKWFNDYFGAVVLMAVIQGVTVFTIREEETIVTLVFEDDDIDYNANDIGPATANRTAFFREQYRLAVGLKLTEIDCTGAIDFAGILTFNDDFAGTVSNSSGSVDYENTGEWITAMESKGFTVIPLDDWIPRPPDEFYPRYTVRFSDESPVYEVEPSHLTVELTDKFNRKTTYTGKVSDVMDNCRLKGILLQYNAESLRVGTEPGTPFTKVKITISDRQFDPVPSDSWQDSNWRNPTVSLSNNNRTISGNFGWDDLPEFWCFQSFVVNGATGTAGDTLYFGDIDYTVKGTLTESERNVTVATDFTETCSWNTHNPVLCRQLNQVDEASATISARLVGRGGKIFDFNQNGVWGPEGTMGYMCQARDYRPTALRWLPNAFNYGYSIPEPDMPM